MSKRMHARVSVGWKVEFRHAQGKGEGMLLDLNLRGCRIQGVYTGSTGTRLRLQLWLPDHSQPVQVEMAAVQWIKNNQLGVSFLNLSPDAQARLAQVFGMLHEAQPQPEACAIPISASGGLKPESVSPSARRGFWTLMDRL